MDEIRLPRRQGDAPLLADPALHEQLTQAGPVEVQKQLVEWVRDLPAVRVGPSFVSVPGTLAFHLQPEHARGPVRAFQAGTEFAHLHPSYDGSLHVTLPSRLRRQVTWSGWGMPDPGSGVVLLFAPRDDGELTVSWALVQASYRFALGTLEDWPDVDDPP